VFTPASRIALRDWLVDLARNDERITAAAILGSAAEEREDRWSDIDLALRLAAGEDVAEVAESWTALIQERSDVVTHLDLWLRGALYRVFVFADTLQVDLSFWTDESFAAHGPRFRLLFGETNDPVPVTPPAAGEVLGLAWLYALHVRSSIARRRAWQAVYMLNAVREQTIQLACLRHGLPTNEGRGVDELPRALTRTLAETMPTSTHPDELQRAFGALTALMLGEATYVDRELARRLDPLMTELVRSSQPGD